ncbi:MAG: ABC transporter substrate-binding protein [Rhizobacter sp.]|nr:ABC transporter substrate-binding protein [Rhizobacter sp.]
MIAVLRLSLRVATGWFIALHAGMAASETLNLAVSHGPVSLAIYVAAADGLFDKEGLTVKQLDCSSGRDCFRLMAEGAAEIATAAELVATLNSFARQDLAMIATISTSSQQIKLVGRRSAGITLPAHLAGKRVGTVPGSSAQYFLDSWLLFHDIGPQQIKMVGLAPEQFTASLQRAEVDAVAIWEPVASNALSALGTDGLLLPTPRVYTQHFGLITTHGVIASQEAALLKLLRALVRAERLIADDPARAGQVLMARLGYSAASAQAQLKEHDFRIRLDQSLVSTMSSQSRWALREHYAKPATGANRLANVVQPAMLRKVAPNAVALAR